MSEFFATDLFEGLGSERFYSCFTKLNVSECIYFYVHSQLLNKTVEVSHNKKVVSANGEI